MKNEINEIVGRRENGLTFVSELFGGEHIRMSVSYEKDGRGRNGPRGIYMSLTGGEYRTDKYGASFRTEIFGKHKHKAILLKEMNRGNKKVLQEMQETYLNVEAALEQIEFLGL